ncbi:MAG TPA: hypothetical protein VG758_14850 [Hyphomicrobiaceae bacterium]|jgi:hypothetical protein|nr:hypothetical protein [Hyphomicrobiaceae bacterium]
MHVLLGIALLAAGLVLLYRSIPERGQVVQRTECLEVSLAIAVTIALGCGAMFIVTGIADFCP